MIVFVILLMLFLHAVKRGIRLERLEEHYQFSHHLVVPSVGCCIAFLVEIFLIVELNLAFNGLIYKS